MHPVVQERSRIAESKVIAVVGIVRDNTFGTGGTYRQIRLILIGTRSQRHIILYIGTRIEEILRVVCPKRRFSLVTPGLHFTRTIDIAVLKLRHNKRLGKLRTVGNLD